MDLDKKDFAILVLTVAMVCIVIVGYVACIGIQKEAYNQGYTDGFTNTQSAFGQGNSFGISGWQAKTIAKGNITMCKVNTNCCKILDGHYNQVGSIGC